jgi:hypothetical protein
MSDNSTEQQDFVLIRDMIIPAGTVFSKAPDKTERPGGWHVQAALGLSDNTCGSVEYCLDDDEEVLRKWFVPLKETAAPSLGEE